MFEGTDFGINIESVQRSKDYFPIILLRENDIAGEFCADGEI